MSSNALVVDGLSKVYRRQSDALGRALTAVHLRAPDYELTALTDVSLTIKERRIFGIAGESGSGKSTLAKIIAGVMPATSGKIELLGIATDSSSTERSGLDVQMIFQDYSASLNPRMRISSTISEAAIANGLVSPANRTAFAVDLLSKVGLSDDVMSRFPHELSGGQRQRVNIARALSVNPKLLVCDEPISALDVSVQAQIVNLFLELRDALDLTIILISHDLSMIRHICDEVAIMYLGRIVEQADVGNIFKSPKHPYTKALLWDSPRVSKEKQSFQPLAGEIPSPLSPPSGCQFHPRCPIAVEHCEIASPNLISLSNSQAVACHLAERAVQ